MIRLSNTAVEPDDLTITERRVLSELANGRATPAALADWTGAAISSVHNALGRLKVAGHVEKTHDSGLYELLDDPRDAADDDDSDGETAATAPTRADTTAVDTTRADDDLRDRVERVLDDGEYAATPERVGAAVAVLETLREYGELTTTQAGEIARESGVTIDTVEQWWSETARPLAEVESERGSNTYRWAGDDGGETA